MTEAPSPIDTPTATRRPGSGRRLALVAAAACAVVGLGGLTAVAIGSGDDAAPTSVEFAAGAPTGVMSSCIEFSPDLLADVDAAFDGTVASVTDESVTLDVSTWFKGGAADQVVLSIASGAAQVSIDGVAFEPGGRYLVSATAGNVNTCGLSGPHSPELEAAFRDAFPG
ncbi:MAG TPA: hypothetical protein VFZ83_10505 [Acidimicrobiia bacterium]|nr:hypothetical protein [Acidimicrobiia bacterium]